MQRIERMQTDFDHNPYLYPSKSVSNSVGAGIAVLLRVTYAKIRVQSPCLSVSPAFQLKRSNKVFKEASCEIDSF